MRRSLRTVSFTADAARSTSRTRRSRRTERSACSNTDAPHCFAAARTTARSFPNASDAHRRAVASCSTAARTISRSPCEDRDPRIEFEANSTSCPLSHSRVDDLAVCVESPCLAVCAESAATPSQSERGLRQDGCFVEPQEPEPLDLAHGLVHVRRRARVNLPPPSFGLLQVPLGLPKPAAAPLEFPKQRIHLFVVTHLADGPLDRHTARPRTRPGPRRRRRRSRS